MAEDFLLGLVVGVLLGSAGLLWYLLLRELGR